MYRPVPKECVSLDGIQPWICSVVSFSCLQNVGLSSPWIRVVLGTSESHNLVSFCPTEGRRCTSHGRSWTEISDLEASQVSCDDLGPTRPQPPARGRPTTVHSFKARPRRRSCRFFCHRWINCQRKRVTICDSTLQTPQPSNML